MSSDYTPVLTDDGKAIQMQDGWPLVKAPNSAEPVPWNIAKQAGALSEANTEAEQRRLALEKLAQGFGLTGDIRKADGIQALIDKASAAPADSDELKRLRELEASGQLGEEATEAKIKAEADKRSSEKIAALESDLARATKDRGEFKASADRSNAELVAAMTRQGVESFYDQARADESGKLPAFRDGARNGFVRAVMTPENGRRWTWNGKRDASGVPIVVLQDAEGHVVKGADNIDALGLGQYSKEALAKSDSYLFEPADGQTGVNQFGPPAAKNFGDMSQEEIDATARSQAQPTN